MGVNKWFGVGNLTDDPKSGYVKDDMLVVNFSMACNEGKDKVEYIRVVAFKKLAEIVRDYLSKGRLVYVEGTLRTRSYDDKQGVKRYMTEVYANNVQILDKKGEDRPVRSPVKDDEDIPF